MSKSKRSFVALHSLVLFDPDFGQSKHKAGSVLSETDLGEEKEIARLLRKRAIRETTAGEAKAKTAPLVPGKDDSELVGDTSDQSAGVPNPVARLEEDEAEEEEVASGADLTVAQLKEWLTEAGVEYDASAKKADLAALYDANAQK